MHFSLYRGYLVYEIIADFVNRVFLISLVGSLIDILFLLAILFNALEADWPEMHDQDSRSVGLDDWSVGLDDRSVSLDNRCIGFSWPDGNFLTKNLDVFQEIMMYRN